MRPSPQPSGARSGSLPAHHNSQRGRVFPYYLEKGRFAMKIAHSLTLKNNDRPFVSEQQIFSCAWSFLLPRAIPERNKNSFFGEGERRRPLPPETLSKRRSSSGTRRPSFGAFYPKKPALPLFRSPPACFLGGNENPRHPPACAASHCSRGAFSEIPPFKKKSGSFAAPFSGSSGAGRVLGGNKE